MGKDDLRQAKYVIDIGPLPSLPVAGSDLRFPVGRILCVGRNYAEHAREKGHDPDREPPIFLMKAPNTIEGAAPRTRFISSMIPSDRTAIRRSYPATD